MIFLPLALMGCKSHIFGCSRNERPPLDLKLGIPGETKVDNQLPANPNVKTMEEDEKITFTSDDGEATITHHSDRTIEKGNILIGNPEQQFLVRVAEVKSRPDGGTTLVKLRQGRIEDVVGDQSGSLKIESTPIFDLEDLDDLRQRAQNADDQETIYNVDENGRLIIRNLELFSVDINSDGKISGGANKILGIPIKNPYEKLAISSAVGGRYRATVNEAIIHVHPTVRSDVNWDFGRLAHLESRLDTKITYRVDLTYEAAGQISMEALLDAFMPKKVIPIRIPGVPPAPPIYLDIELGIPAGVSLKASQKGKTRVIFEAEYEFFSTMNYTPEKGVTTDSDQRVSINETKISASEADTKLEAELFLKPQVTARLYRVAGPFAYLKPYVRGEVEWPSPYKRDDLFIGVSGGVGLEISEPVFLATLVSYDSGNIFDYSKSFDLDNSGGSPHDPLAVEPELNTSVTVDQIGPEGFVVLRLKTPEKNGFLRYEILRSTKTGLLIPSETFYMDGELFYYPMPKSQKESFVARIYGKDGQFKDIEIHVNVADNVQTEVSKDRYGTTTNSYKVASGSPGDFKGSVAQYGLGTVIEDHLTQCLDWVEAHSSPQKMISPEEFTEFPGCRPYTPFSGRVLGTTCTALCTPSVSVPPWISHGSRADQSLSI